MYRHTRLQQKRRRCRSCRSVKVEVEVEIEAVVEVSGTEPNRRSAVCRSETWVRWVGWEITGSRREKSDGEASRHEVMALVKMKSKSSRVFGGDEEVEVDDDDVVTSKKEERKKRSTVRPLYNDALYNDNLLIVIIFTAHNYFPIQISHCLDICDIISISQNIVISN